MRKFIEKLAGSFGSGFAIGMCMPIYIFVFNTWMRLLVQHGWIDLGWLKEALR